MITYDTSTRNISFIAGFDSTASKTEINQTKKRIKQRENKENGQ